MVESAPDGSKIPPRVAGGGDGCHRSLPLRLLLLASLPPVLLGVLVALVVAARSGPGVTPDSVAYLAAADSLLDGEGFRGPDGEPFVAFPPLFSALIAAASLGIFDLVDAASAVVALSFGVTIVAGGWMTGRITGSRLAATAAAFAVLVSTPVLDAALHIWSEAPFMAFTMICLGALTHQTGRRSRRGAAAATVAAACAALTRYVGVALTLTHVLTVFARRRIPAVDRLREAVVALLGLGPLLLWLVRNLLVSGTLTGERHPAAATLGENARASVETLLTWLAPIDAPMRFRALLVLLFTAALLAVLLPPAIRGEVRSRRLLWACLPLAGFCSLYLTYLIFAASITALDPIDRRLIAPLLPPAVVLVFSGVFGMRWASGRWRQAARIGVLLLLCLWLGGSATGSVRLIHQATTDGVGGYVDHTWQDSQTLAYLREQAAKGVLYSNDPFAIRYWTEHAARLSPRRHPYRSPNATVDDLSDLRAALGSSQEVYLVWFDGVPRDFLLSLTELAMILEVEPVSRLDDGTVYRLR